MHDLADESDGLAVFPQALGFGVQPGRGRIGVKQAAQPHGAGFGVHVLDRAVRVQDLVGAHGGVTDEDQLVVGAVFMDDVEQRHALGVATVVVAPHAFVDAVVEVEIFEVLEFQPAGGEEFLAHLDVVVHRAADVEKQQHLDRVVALGPHHQVQPARVARGGGDGAIEIQFVGRTLARKTAQAAQRDLDVARAQLDRIVEIAKLALVPDLDRAAVAG